MSKQGIKEIKCTSYACPLQYEGELWTGEHFYFRERHGFFRFTISTGSVVNAVRRELAVYHIEGKESELPDNTGKFIEKNVKKYNEGVLK